jgi:hypothetical protein
LVDKFGGNDYSFNESILCSQQAVNLFRGQILEKKTFGSDFGYHQ